MRIIIILVLVIALRFFEVGPFASLSWWWIGGLMVAAFIWFEFIERLLGLDQRTSHDKLEKAREERVKKTFR
ncbi:MAG: TIGR04438 family Trp-rich protein [Burkholderiales bacterium]